MKLFVKVHSSFKNKRNSLLFNQGTYKNELFGLSADIPKLIPFTTNFIVLFTNIYRVTGGGDLIKLKVQLLLKFSPTNSYIGTHTWFTCTSMWIFTQRLKTSPKKVTSNLNSSCTWFKVTSNLNSSCTSRSRRFVSCYHDLALICFCKFSTDRTSALTLK